MCKSNITVGHRSLLTDPTRPARPTILSIQPHPAHQKFKNKKAELPERWPRDAPYTWLPRNFSSPWVGPQLLFPTFQWAIVPIYPVNLHNGLLFIRVDPVNVPAKFEVRSFTRSWDNIDWSFGWGLRTPKLGEQKAVGGRGWYCSNERWWVSIGPP